VDHGEERDLVPPSDVEEYEIWRKERVGNKERREAGSQSTLGGSLLSPHVSTSAKMLRFPILSS
jgi:hypothetical protein